MAAASARLPVRVARKIREAQDICSLELVPAGGDPLPHFAAGSHIDVHLPDGITRQYSLCNPAGVEDRYQVCVLRDPNSRGGSAAVHDQLAQGDLLEISEPKNHFSLAHGAPFSVLIAGGIGITPLICMAERLHHTGAKFQMHYCAKSSDRTAFRDRIAASAYRSQVEFHFSATSGRADMSELLRGAERAAHVYVCGPQKFIDAVLSAARSLGWPEDRLHREYFASNVTLGKGDSFDVKLASSGQVVPIQPDETVLAALHKA
ncbi:MAG: ferredoxin reductase, partial [Longimicrobiales bacterium]